MVGGVSQCSGFNAVQQGRYICESTSKIPPLTIQPGVVRKLTVVARRAPVRINRSPVLAYVHGLSSHPSTGLDSSHAVQEEQR